MTAPARRSLAIVAGGAVFLAATLISGTLLAPAARDLAPWNELDARWGTYLPERQWGTPHEAVGGDGWGLDYLSAVRRDYSFGEDGIAGLTERSGTFNLGWAAWDGLQVRVAERYFGWSNPSGEHGEAIVDRRVFDENTPTSSYTATTWTYPNSDPRYEIDMVSARADASSGVMAATATNTSDEGGTLQLVLKGWLTDPALRAEVIDDGLLLHGPDSVVAIVGDGIDSSQASDEKRALDEQLREHGSLAGGTEGHSGALAHELELGPAETRMVSVGWAEADAAEAAGARARELRERAPSVLAFREDEAATLFTGRVTAHEPLFRQALMSTLWNQSLYAWDGTSSYDPDWAGRVDAHDVLVMPDKWEFPWLATWDTGFQAVVATLIDPQLAADQLRFLFSDRWQQPNGHLPCAEWVMADECPPVFAWAAWRIHLAGAGDDFLADVYPGLVVLHDYWWSALAVEPRGLFTCGFCGMDNLPRGAGQAQADASGWMAFSARHLALIADELGDDEAAARFRAEVDEIAAAVNEVLWDADEQFYLDRNDDGVAPIRTRSYSGLVPLIAGIVPEERVDAVLDALRDEGAFLSPYGIRSTAADSVLYRPGYADERSTNSSWRGPVWLPLNYLIIGALAETDPALAADLRERVVEMVETDWEATGRLHEYFDAETGEGLGADAQAGWTALVANLIVEGWPAD
jgi:hypothetical protein